MTKAPMENVYRGIMPIEGSQQQMGVTITSKMTPSHNMIKDLKNKSISVSRVADIGVSANSIMSRYTQRNSPAKQQKYLASPVGGKQRSRADGLKKVAKVS